MRRIARTNAPDFDGLNIYGDEIDIPIPFPAPLSPIRIRRTGFKEEDLLGDDQGAKNIKVDASIHYRAPGIGEISYAYRVGISDAILHAADKYVLRNFGQMFHKIELKGSGYAKNYLVRLYSSSTLAGRSYNMGALGLLANEAYRPTVDWATDYATRYTLAIQGHVENVVGGDPTAAHAFGTPVRRTHAPRYRLR